MLAGTLVVFLSLAATKFSKAIDGHDNRIIVSYMKEKLLNHVSIIGCFNDGQPLIMKQLWANLKYAAIFSTKNKNDVFIVNKSNNYQEGVILYTNCGKIKQFLHRWGEMNSFDTTHHWLIISDDLNILSYLNLTKLNIDCDINVLIINSDQENFDIWDVYNPASEHGGKLRYAKIGEYSHKKGYRIQQRGMKYTIRRDMSDVKFRAMVTLPVDIDRPLMDYLEYDEKREINTFNRFHCRLMYFCRDYYNFSIKSIGVTKSWGYLLPNHSFDGMVGALERKEIDISLSPLFFRSDRLQKIDYGRRTWTLRVAFIFRNPKVPASFMVFLKPLSFSIWLTTLAFLMASIIIYRIINASEQTFITHWNQVSWSELVIFILGTISQQGSNLTSNLLCGRIVILFVLLLSLLVYQFYSASIVSILLMQPPSPIKSTEDLIASKMECRSQNILYIKDYFNRVTDKITLDLYHTKLLTSDNVSYFISPREGLDLVIKGGYAFYVELATAYPIIEKTFNEDVICELKEITVMPTQQMFNSFQKGSPFKQMFDVRIQRFAEVGILNRELKHWEPRRPECLQTMSPSKFSVGLSDLYPAFVFLLFGIIISISIYFFESYEYSRSGRDQIEKEAKSLYPFTN